MHNILSGIVERFVRGRLFDGNDRLFKRLARGCTRYGEYGCGASTLWVSRNTEAPIHSVDTSEDWIEFCRKKISRGGTHLEWIDCGGVGKWGRPIGYAKRDQFVQYAKSIWNGVDKPDLVLIDGRFRVLCFLVSLKHAGSGTNIIFDDYTARPIYHVIEEFVSRQEVFGRQCHFIVPSEKEINREKLDWFIEKFEYVMD
jgi:hypothetical protein